MPTNEAIAVFINESRAALDKLAAAMVAETTPPTVPPKFAKGEKVQVITGRGTGFKPGTVVVILEYAAVTPDVWVRGPYEGRIITQIIPTEDLDRIPAPAHAGWTPVSTPPTSYRNVEIMFDDGRKSVGYFNGPFGWNEIPGEYHSQAKKDPKVGWGIYKPCLPAYWRDFPAPEKPAKPALKFSVGDVVLMPVRVARVRPQDTDSPYGIIPLGGSELEWFPRAALEGGETPKVGDEVFAWGMSSLGELVEISGDIRPYYVKHNGLMHFYMNAVKLPAK